MGGVPVFVFRSFFVNLTKITEIFVHVQNQYVFPYCREEVYLKKKMPTWRKNLEKRAFLLDPKFDISPMC